MLADAASAHAGFALSKRAYNHLLTVIGPAARKRVRVLAAWAEHPEASPEEIAVIKRAVHECLELAGFHEDVLADE